MRRFVATLAAAVLLAACAPRTLADHDPDSRPAVDTATTPDAPTAIIHRDAWGAPHVLADTDAGAVFGMAWALAEDDWPLIEENYLHALGRYAEVAGETGVRDDWMARALEIVPLSIAEYDAASPRIRGLLDAFAAGLNAWLDTRPRDELRVLSRIEPWYPLALIRYKYYQNEYLGYAGLRGAWAERLFEAAVASMQNSNSNLNSGSNPSRYFEAQFDGLGFRPRGSNQWALAPSRTASGHAMLLINPHQSFVGVQRYAEIHIDSREGLRFSGLTVFGFLLPYMGHNEALGWAYTDNYADHSDLYAITFDGDPFGDDAPGDASPDRGTDDDAPLRYRYDDGWRTATTWTDSIRVRTDAGFVTRTFRHWKTHHGPIVGIDDGGRPLAVRMARYVEGGWYDQWDAMIRARSLEEWRAGIAMLRVAYMNTMYADREGNIGYIYNSAVPVRLPGVDPSGILDGSDPATEWQGFHSFDELPQVWNPDTGWLLNANSTPFTATTGLAIERDDFPAYMVGPETDNARAASSRRVLRGLDGVTFDDFATRVWDSWLSLAHDDIIPALMEEWAATSFPADDPAGADLARAIDRLARWDRVADTASVETTWFTLMVERRSAARSRGQTAGPGRGEDASWVAALADALRLLREEWGTDEVAWGRLNRHQRPLPGQSEGLPGLDPDRPSLAVGGASGGFGSVFSYYSRPVAGPAGPRIGLGGNSFVKVIEFGPTPRARSVLNYGQSGDPASAHFFDQAALYVRRDFKPAWWGRAEVRRETVESVEVGSRGGG